MAAKFDNINDVNGKFVGTICYYDKKAVFIKEAGKDGDGDFVVWIQFANGTRGRFVKLTDPAFSYRDFNIGYSNNNQYAVWWYRIPHKQYRQGLKKDQMSCFCPEIPHAGMEYPFQFNKPFALMLQNEYPNIQEASKLLRDAEEGRSIVAFHRDFALKWDRMHQDHILEYRGNQVGVNINSSLTEFRLVPEFQHVQEALKEALC